MNRPFCRFVSAWCAVALQLTLCGGFASAQTSPQNTIDEIASLRASARWDGVLVQWIGEVRENNLGFNVYRLSSAGRTKLNQEVIPGGVFYYSKMSPTTRSFGFLDHSGRVDSVYEVESVNVGGDSTSTHRVGAALDSQFAVRKSPIGE